MGRKFFFLLMGFLLFQVVGLFSSHTVQAAGSLIKIIVNGGEVFSDVSPLLSGERVFVPIRVISEELGAKVQWDREKHAVIITKDEGGAKYLKGYNFSFYEGNIGSNLITAEDLMKLLDDDEDMDIADYREGRTGGDDIENDPLVLDIRQKAEYDQSHIPGAVWVEGAANIVNKESIQKLKALLDEHAARGGKKEIVLYCYTGNQSGLAVGVLGAQGLPVKSMMFGFDIAWRGTKSAPKAIYAPMEDEVGNRIECKT